MKKTIYIITLFSVVSFLSYSQNSVWSTEQNTVLEKYGLQQDDNRGLILHFSDYSDCSGEIKSIKEALEIFLTSGVRRDITEICVKKDSDFSDHIGNTLDIYQITLFYIGVSSRN